MITALIECGGYVRIENYIKIHLQPFRLMVTLHGMVFGAIVLVAFVLRYGSV